MYLRVGVRVFQGLLTTEISECQSVQCNIYSWNPIILYLLMRLPISEVPNHFVLLQFELFCISVMSFKIQKLLIINSVYSASLTYYVKCFINKIQ